MHRFCKACIEGYWQSHVGSAGCPEAGCGKAVVGQGGCKTDPMCDALVAELLKAGGGGQTSGMPELLEGGLVAFPTTSGQAGGAGQSPGGRSGRFDAYFLEDPLSALEVAMRAAGGIQPWRTECPASLRPLYSLFLLRDEREEMREEMREEIREEMQEEMRDEREARLGEGERERVSEKAAYEGGRLPFQHVAVPRHKTAGDVRQALSGYMAEAGSGRVSMHLEWADPAGGVVPCGCLIEDESLPFEVLLRRLDVDDSTRVLTLKLKLRL